MNTPFRPELSTLPPAREVPFLRPMAAPPVIRLDPAKSLAMIATARRLPDFSIFLPRDPSTVLPQGIPASTLRRSGFVL